MTLSEIEIGRTAKLSKTFTEADLAAFAALCGDRNPLHMDAGFARNTNFQRRVVHGMLLSSFVSTLVGMHVPGPGALWSRQTFRWLAPVFIGDTVEVVLTVNRKSEGAGAVTIEVKAVNQDGRTVMEGEGVVTLVGQRTARADDVSEPVALVTGASRGIGAAVALALARSGIRVAVNYLHREEDAREVCRAIEKRGGQAMPVYADVSDPAGVAGAVDRIAGMFGSSIGILVNNASSPPVQKLFADLGWDEVQSFLDVQVKGTFECCKAVIPGMLANGHGVIVNIGSALTRSLPPAGSTALLLAKSALHGLTRALAAELGPRGIRVNSVSPGMTETDSLASVPERLRKIETMRNPLRRLGSPEQVASAVAFLCSEGGRYITGADIPVCGGTSM